MLRRLVYSALLLACLFQSRPSGHWRLPGRITKTEPVAGREVLRSVERLPLSFEPNQDRFDQEVKFVARAVGFMVFLTRAEAVISLEPPAVPAGREGFVPRLSEAASEREAGDPRLRIQMLGGAANPDIAPADELPGRSSYFVGNDPAQWHAAIPTYAKVRYHNVYPGIDTLYYGTQRHLEFDFIVSPGADPTAIRLRIAGSSGLELTPEGDVSVHLPEGELELKLPEVYQKVGSTKVRIPGKYELSGCCDV